MNKDELKELLKEHLEISISVSKETDDYGIDTIVTRAEVEFDNEVVAEYSDARY